MFSDNLLKKLFEYYSNIKTDFDITIKDNHIYICVSSGNIFSPIPYTWKEDLYYSYKILNFIFELSEDLIDVTNSYLNK